MFLRLRRLADILDEGPAAQGFRQDERWHLTRMSDLIARLFHTLYALGDGERGVPRGRA
jgi:hypothetical protein